MKKVSEASGRTRVHESRGSDGGELVQRCSLQLRWKQGGKQKRSRISCRVWSQKQSGPIKSQLYFPFPKNRSLCLRCSEGERESPHLESDQLMFTCIRSLSARCRSIDLCRAANIERLPPETSGQDNEELTEVETDISFHAI